MAKEKETITIRITKESRDKLDKMKDEIGISYGSLIDLMLKKVKFIDIIKL